jgi:hypothetical protein
MRIIRAYLCYIVAHLEESWVALMARAGLPSEVGRCLLVKRPSGHVYPAHPQERCLLGLPYWVRCQLTKRTSLGEWVVDIKFKFERARGGKSRAGPPNHRFSEGFRALSHQMSNLRFNSNKIKPRHESRLLKF